VSRSRQPRRLASALGAVRSSAAPLTLLAGVQAVWAQAVGPGIAAEAEPVGERDGVITVACRSSTWAQEIDLLQAEIVARLNAALEGSAPASVSRLRATSDQSRFTS
jgi:predicted nucleic acid-binding Zn ribbon protein